ncbi:AhpD-like protein [Schizothecium vesticola]|uniref:AhpD-like protein n=1 Tax=Schizothecium vesticola TaxID=314040 RepID=A0AA40EKZ3_9PEZI|nr:AhpD-like protein [Schizothecium vesticola]
MRLPYVTDPPPAATPEEEAIIDAVRARRAPRPLQPLDLTLLHSPPVTLGWNHFLSAIRTQTTLPADIRELAICRVAVVNRAWYEWMHHAPLASAAGVTPAGMDVCKDPAPLVLEAGSPEGSGLTEKQWLVLCYADEMTRSVEIACYNCVSRFLVALDIGEKNGTGPDVAH